MSVVCVSPASPMTTCRVHDLPPQDWQTYASTHPHGCVFHDPRWALVMREAYGNECFFLVARRQDRVVGVLQLVRQRSMLLGRQLCSVPYLDASGILADDDAATKALLEEAAELMLQQHVSTVELRQYQPLPGDLPLRSDKLTMRLDLPAGQDALMQQLRSKMRNQVRKALSMGMAPAEGGIERLDEFYHVYARTMRDLGSPAHSRRFFQVLMEHMGSQASIFSVRDGQRVVAASLVVQDARRMYVPWAGSDWRRGSEHSNVVLYWSMLAEAADRGLQSFDFGRCTRDSGTHNFKRKWGGTEIPLCWQYVLRPGRRMSPGGGASVKRRFAEACWRKLPLRLACYLGPKIIRKVS